MALDPLQEVEVPSPICGQTLRVHAFRAWWDGDVRCRDCGLVMPLAAALRDGPNARHCVACGWWTPEAECRAGAVRCAWCKQAFEE